MDVRLVPIQSKNGKKKNLIKTTRNQFVFTNFRLILEPNGQCPFVFQINRKMVNKIGFRVDLIRFLCVYS